MRTTRAFLSGNQQNMKPNPQNPTERTQLKDLERKLTARLKFLEHYQVSKAVIRDEALKLKVELSLQLPSFYASNSWISHFKKKTFPQNPNAFSRGQKIISINVIKYGECEAIQATVKRNANEVSILNCSFEEQDENDVEIMARTNDSKINGNHHYCQLK